MISKHHIKQKSPQLLVLLIALVVFLYFNFFHAGPGDSPVKCSGQCESSFPQTIASCRNCMPLKNSKIPYDKDIGEYLDKSVYDKLLKLTALDSNWRVTEAFPSTVKHLSFCHYVGTCADIGLYHSKLNLQNLADLCKHALAAGLNVINEYSYPIILNGNKYCPRAEVFETTTGNNLHVY